LEVGCDASDTREQNREMEMEKVGEATGEMRAYPELKQGKSNKKQTRNTDKAIERGFNGMENE
jgi:hypothetical protein